MSTTPSGTLWRPEHPAGHQPFCAHPSHSPAGYCAADEADPPTMHGLPSRAWHDDHPGGCLACATGRGRHTCGLAGLQDMIRIGP